MVYSLNKITQSNNFLKLSVYYQYIDDNDLYQPVQKHKRSYKKVFITVLVLILVAFVVEFISIAYEARKSFINREIVEITYDD